MDVKMVSTFLRDSDVNDESFEPRTKCFLHYWVIYQWISIAGFSPPTLPLCQKRFPLNHSQLSASSEWNGVHKAANGVSNQLAHGGRTGTWSARYNKDNQWLQIDLRNTSKVTIVATQGREDISEWVKSYIIEYRLYGTDFLPYKVNDTQKVRVHSIKLWLLLHKVVQAYQS